MNLLLTIQLYSSGNHAKLMLLPTSKVCQISDFHRFTSLNWKSLDFWSDRSHVKKSPWAQSNCVTVYGQNNEWFMKVTASAWHDWDISAQVIINYSCSKKSVNRFLALTMDCTVNEESLGSLLVRQRKTFEDVNFLIFNGQSQSCKKTADSSIMKRIIAALIKARYHQSLSLTGVWDHILEETQTAAPALILLVINTVTSRPRGWGRAAGEVNEIRAGVEAGIMAPDTTVLCRAKHSSSSSTAPHHLVPTALSTLTAGGAATWNHLHVKWLVPFTLYPSVPSSWASVLPLAPSCSSPRDKDTLTGDTIRLELFSVSVSVW